MKIVVSTSRMIGLMSVSPVSFSIEMVSSEFSSSAMTSSAKPSLASSSTRCDCSVFFRMSLICESVATLVDDAAAQQQADLVDHHQLAGIGDRDDQPAVGCVFQRHEVVAEHQVHRDLAEQLVLDVEVLQVDELAAIAPRQILAVLDLVVAWQDRRCRLTKIALGSAIKPRVSALSS